MGIIKDLRHDIDNLTNGIDKKWLEEHVKHLKSEDCEVTGLSRIGQLEAVDSILTEAQIKEQKKWRKAY